MTRPINPREVVYQLRALAARQNRVAALLDRLAPRCTALLESAEMMRDGADYHERLAQIVEMMEDDK